MHVPSTEENVPVVQVITSDVFPGTKPGRQPSSQDVPDGVDVPQDPAV